MDYQRILVFGAHPDDENTMAATMAKLAAAGVDVMVCIMTDGSEGFPDPSWRDRIVAMRAAEMEECDQVVGIKRRFRLDRPDMGLVYDKQVFKDSIRVVREARPDAVFTHGPAGINPDHVATHQITVPAVWQAGEPVAADLGEPWEVRHLFYYKEVSTSRRALGPSVVFDVTGFDHFRQLANATQVSQHTLFEKTREEFEAEAARIKAANKPASETFWMSERFVLRDFPPREA
ncbi:MAG: PIG-L family deacetylase [Armatimonadetes bacterium]|nr:PIG-L family deacetylase [Armatimonadota bacterium]